MVSSMKFLNSNTTDNRLSFSLHLFNYRSNMLVNMLVARSGLKRVTLLQFTPSQFKVCWFNNVMKSNNAIQILIVANIPCFCAQQSNILSRKMECFRIKHQPPPSLSWIYFMGLVLKDSKSTL